MWHPPYRDTRPKPFQVIRTTNLVFDFPIDQETDSTSGSVLNNEPEGVFEDGSRCSEIEIELRDPRVAAALQIHYGWIRLTGGAPGGVSGTITGYAYETIPNKRVLAGVTSKTSTDTQAQENFVLALAQPAEGKVIVTKTNIQIYYWRKRRPACVA